MTVIDRSIALDPTTCRQLLGTVRVGRVALPEDPSPAVLPVDFVVHDGHVLFRTVEGTKLSAAQSNGPASFQADGVDATHDTGWSVLVRGRLEEADSLTDDEADALDQLRPLVGGTRDHVVRMSMDSVTGRSIRQDPEWVRAHRETNTWTDRDASDLMG